MNIKNLLINRLSFLEKIDAETEKYRKKTGYPIPNVSGWETGDDYRELMLGCFNFSEYNEFNPIDYFYSYNLGASRKHKLIERFGGENGTSLLITANNTVSLINVVNFIANYCSDNICLLSPCYFTLPNLLNNRQLSYKNLTVCRDQNGYKLPTDEIISYKCKTLILTSPIFSTGRYFSEDDLDFIEYFLSRGNYVISDESLAAPGYELLRYFKNSPNFIGIYSPHKFIHFNSFKFSAIVYNERFEDFFDQWNDVFSGSLNATNLHAVHNFLSDNYAILLENFYAFTQNKRHKILNLLNNFPTFNTDKDAIGDFQCIYSKELPFELENSLKLIKNVLKNTDAVFYPGTLHGFQKEHGFSFRVNLISYTEQAQNALLKILSYLSDAKFI